MTILVESVEISLGTRSIKHYEELGYIIPKTKNNKGKLVYVIGTKINVKIEHLLPSTKIAVPYECDYCGEKDFKEYGNLIIGRNIISKDSCEQCKGLKMKETNLIVYGVEATMQLDSTRQKSKETFMKKYGVEHNMQIKENKEKREKTYLQKYGYTSASKNEKVKEKIKQTNLEKYGVESPFQSNEIKQRIKETNLIKYGVTNPMQNKFVKKKAEETNIERYGTPNPSQNKEIREKMSKTLFENNTAPCSIQQKYIHSLLGGTLNYQFSKLLLDIAFVDDKIYLEYDGGGHSLNVELGKITQEEFNKKENKRWHFLLDNGWREVRVISSKDKLPSDKKLIEMFAYARNYLNTGRRMIKFNIDNSTVETSQFVKEYDFGKLRKIKNNLTLLS
jgi:hypothetical protein